MCVGLLELERVSSLPGCASHILRRALITSVVLTSVLVGGGLVGDGLVGDGIATAEAANYRIRSITIGRATQYFRSDQTVTAPRIFTQGLSLWGYDLLGDRTGSVNLHLAIRYMHGIPDEDWWQSSSATSGEPHKLLESMPHTAIPPGSPLQNNHDHD